MSQTYMDKLNTDFRVASVIVAPKQTTKQPLYFSYLHFRIKMFNGTWYNRSLHMLYITHILLQCLRFCYSFCLTVQPGITNISNVCSTPSSSNGLLIGVCTRDWATISQKLSSETMLASLLKVVTNATDPQRGCIFFNILI